MENTKQGKSFFSSTRIAFIAMFSTLAGVLYILNFSLPFFPSFLEFKLSDIPILIGSFTLGPASGAVIVGIEVLIKLAIKGTSTALVGELSDILTSCAFAVTAGLIYKHKRTFKGALLGMGMGTLAEVVIALLFNRFVLVPFYVQFFFHGDWKILIGMMTKLFPDCTQATFYNFYIWASVLPFNLMRCLVAVVVTLVVYKRISRLINSVNHKLEGKAETGAVKKLNITAIVVGAVIVALLVLFALLNHFVF